MLNARLNSMGRLRQGFPIVLVGMLLVGCNLRGVAPTKSLPEPINSSTDESAASLPIPLSRMTNRGGMSFRLVPAGEFAMGTKDVTPMGELAICEQPRHVVRLTRPFWMGECEVTAGQFRQFVEATDYRTDAELTGDGVNGLDLLTGAVSQSTDRIWSSPGFPQTDQHPVVAVSRNDALEFCVWLSQLEGRTYRLPTEAEWEFACRAGSETPFACGELFDSMMGNVADIALRGKFSGATEVAPWDDEFPFTAPVGSFQPNRFGLFDMHGNVGEWCLDWFDADYYRVSPTVDPRGPAGPTAWRVVRGGSWYNSPPHCRSACRHDGLRTAPSTTNGFRIVIEDE